MSRRRPSPSTTGRVSDTGRGARRPTSLTPPRPLYRYVGHGIDVEFPTGTGVTERWVDTSMLPLFGLTSTFDIAPSDGGSPEYISYAQTYMQMAGLGDFNNTFTFADMDFSAIAASTWDVPEECPETPVCAAARPASICYSALLLCKGTRYCTWRLSAYSYFCMHVW